MGKWETESQGLKNTYFKEITTVTLGHLIDPFDIKKYFLILKH